MDELADTLIELAGIAASDPQRLKQLRSRRRCVGSMRSQLRRIRFSTRSYGHCRVIVGVCRKGVP